uniref:LRRCT domain-containing protein n=1 Tax=Branchiostoma floridae TaxID=7739 RepID=C3XPC3_BRAFL|eukprot:XP_002613785.1 hypothetical protein BRAFLDRAFT_85326 [Branchiostoma floridae]
MAVSGFLLLVAFGSCLLGCSSLPCVVEKRKPFFSVGIRSAVYCNRLGLATWPSDVPSNAERLELVENNIRNVSSFPPLPYLYSLDLSYNSIESVSWMSLRALPALEDFSLQGNRLKYVQLDTVIAHLPKLSHVNLSGNKLTSFSKHALGWPHVNVVINENPFHCDCELSWLIDKLACLEGCKWGPRQACCSSCAACFIVLTGRFQCTSPSQLRRRLLSTLSTHMTDCGPTTEPAKTELPSVENGTFLISDSKTVPTQTQLWMNVSTTESYLQDCSAGVPTRANQTSPYNVTSPTESTDIEDKKEEKHTVRYIVIFLTVAFVAYIVSRTITLCYNRRDLANNVGIDHHSFPLRRLRHLVPPIENTLYHGHVAGGSNHGPPVAPEMTRTSTLENSLHRNTGTSTQDSNHGPPVAQEITSTLPLVNSPHQSTGISTQELNHGQLVDSGECRSTPLENSANELYQETASVSNNAEHYATSNLTTTAIDALYTCEAPTASLPGLRFVRKLVD